MLNFLILWILGLFLQFSYSNSLTPLPKLELSNQNYSITNNPNGLDIYTKEEFQKLPILRNRVMKSLTKAYMFENRYLIRFLRKMDLDLERAETHLQNNLKWRKNRKLDISQPENFAKWQKQYPFFYNIDREKRPGVVGSLKQFDIRRVLLAGELSNFTSFFLSIFEYTNELLPLYTNYTGMEFINGNILFNAAGFNLRAHMCIGCIPFWIEFLQELQSNYPLIVKRLLIINVPRIGDSMFQILKPFISPYLASVLRLYGVDKNDWNEIFKIYPKDQLPLEFGGNVPKKNWKDIWLNLPSDVSPELLQKATQKFLT